MGLAGLGTFVAAADPSLQRLPVPLTFGWIGIIPVVGAGVGWILHHRRRAAAAMASLIVTMAAVAVATFTIVAPPISELQNGPVLRTTLARMSAPATRLGAFQIQAPGTVFYCGTIRELKNPADIVRFFQDNARPVLLTNDDGHRVVRSLLPGVATMVAGRKQFPNKQNMVVLRLDPSAIGGAPLATVAASSTRQSVIPRMLLSQNDDAAETAVSNSRSEWK